MVSQSFGRPYHTVKAVYTTHTQVRLTRPVKREIEMPWRMTQHQFLQTLGGKAITEKCKIGVTLSEPCHDCLGLRMKNKLTPFKSDGGLARHTTAPDHPLNIIQRKVLMGFAPD